MLGLALLQVCLQTVFHSTSIGVELCLSQEPANHSIATLVEFVCGHLNGLIGQDLF